MPRHDISERPDHRTLDPGMLRLEIDQKALESLTFQAQIATHRTATPNDRQFLLSGVGTCLVLPTVDQRTDNKVTPVVRERADAGMINAIDQIRSEIPERDWMIFERLTIDDPLAAEVADEFGVSVNVVYLVKSRILKRLRRQLQAHIDAGEQRCPRPHKSIRKT